MSAAAPVISHRTHSLSSYIDKHIKFGLGLANAFLARPQSTHVEDPPTSPDVAPHFLLSSDEYLSLRHVNGYWEGDKKKGESMVFYHTPPRTPPHPPNPPPPGTPYSLFSGKYKILTCFFYILSHFTFRPVFIPF